MPSIIEHIQISVSDFEKSKNFYNRIADWLGFEDAGEYEGDASFPQTKGYLKDGLKLLISQCQQEGQHIQGAPGLHHIAFRVDAKSDVDRFYHDVLKNLENIQIQDPPIACPEYGNDYYATFFFDPDGIKLEVMYSTT